MMFLSLSARLLVNTEALNMVESVGNVVRHRRAPIVVPTDEGYVLTYAPVVSGESLAHTYQAILAKIAAMENLPVCTNCSKEFFVKHGLLEAFGNQDWEIALREKIEGKEKADAHAIEKAIVKGCVVEDVGGFLLPEEVPVKRTSKFQVGFMIPALDEIRSTSLEAQFHVRYAPDPALHAIYYVETGSALYTLQFNVKLDEIGYTTSLKRERASDRHDETVKLAVKALAHMFENRIFGAHASRYNPVTELRSLIVTISKPLPFTVSPGHSKKYIETTFNRGLRFASILKDESIRGYFVDEEQASTKKEYSDNKVLIKKVGTISEAFGEVLNRIEDSKDSA